jgi:hypothetical protein
MVPEKINGPPGGTLRKVSHAKTRANQVSPAQWRPGAKKGLAS